MEGNFATNQTYTFMADMTKQQRKDYAKILYLNERLTQEEIADRVGVTRVTINRWINSEGWEQLRVSLTIAKDEQLKNLYAQMAQLNESINTREEGKRFATSSEADIISKYAAAIQKMENDVGLGDTIAVCRKLASFLRNQDLAEAKRIVPILDLFIKSLLD